MPSFTRCIVAPIALLAALTTTAAHAELHACLAKLRGEALGKGVAAASFERFTQGLEKDDDVLEKLDYQPEFRTPIWDYLAGLVDAERVADGRARMTEWADLLQRIETQYRVDAYTVAAVWGVESNFGQTFGNRSVVRSLATLSCFGRRQAYFRGEFFTTLKILQEGHVSPERLQGSWAGAFGHTQFMPSTFQRIAVDFDGDGRRDLMDSIPDALASTAHYLQKSGWQSGQPWGYEVRLPQGFDVSQAGRKKKQPITHWIRQGVVRVDGSPLTASPASAAILLPAGAQGPAFLVMRNFDAIFSYNAAESYALAIAHLADRMRGGMPFVTPWPTDDPGLSRAERREVQTHLLALGFDIGAVDGLIGKQSREAIKALQQRHGLEPDGRAGQRVLGLLRRLNP